MGVTQPFMYEKSGTYDFGSPTSRPFNPRAATQASYTPPSQKVKQDGPFINFNRHPDSYIQAPYGHLDVLPMNPNTKSRVMLAWKSQRAFRILGLLGAIGAVFCIIAIRKTSSSVGWIIRVGPTIALLHTLYAVYFLCRAINARPPASCASYQMFAAMVDTGLIPFFVFSGYMAWNDYATNAYGWGTLFNQNDLDYKIIKGFFIVCAVEIGLLFSSLILDIYLAIIYSKIANIRPDMNPLDEKDNLTARPHHKRNKSELLFEKHMSSSTLASQRISQQSQLDVSSRRIPFIHTRTDSADRDLSSVHREAFDDPKTPYTARTSELSQRNDAEIPRPSSAVMPSPNARSAGAGLDHKPARSSNLSTSTTPRPLTWMSYSDYEGMPVEMSNYAQEELEREIRAMSPVSALSCTENHIPPHDRHSGEMSNAYHQATSDVHEHYVSSSRGLDLSGPPDYEAVHKRSLEPLGMNPPTPVNQNYQEKELMVRPLSFASNGTSPRPALQEADLNLVASATPTISRMSSFVGSGTKSRFYGNLRSSIGGSPTRVSREDLYDVERSHSFRSQESGNFEVYASDSDDDDYMHSKPQLDDPAEIHEIVVDREFTGQRQISNSTGFDLHSGYAGLDPEFGQGMARRREVSGKAAEEGRSYVIKASKPVSIQPRPGAAGWARFAGL